MSEKSGQKIKVRCGGVPEHFNHPWQMAVQSQYLMERGVEVLWKPQPEGTGTMCKALRNGELDMAVLLTEGAVLDKLSGGNFRIVSTYTTSPIIWGVHLAANHNHELDTLVEPGFAISRYGSGSHLMSYLFARKMGWDMRQMDFKIVYGLEGARNVLKHHPPRLFLWEKFSTRPFIRSGEFRFLDEISTPWSSTVIAVNEDFFQKHQDLVSLILCEVITQSQRLKNYIGGPNLIAGAYHLLTKDVEEWFEKIEWNDQLRVDPIAIHRIVKEYSAIGLVPSNLSEDEIITRIIGPVEETLVK